MPPIIKADFEGSDNRVIEFLKSRKPQILAALQKKMTAEMIALQSHIVSDKLSGQVLQHRSGHLIDSIRLNPNPATLSADEVTGGVQGGGGVAFYGRFHEYGTTRSYVIKPIDKKALAFMLNGKKVVVKSVVHPPIKERSFMRSSLADMKDSIISGLKEALDGALR